MNKIYLLILLSFFIIPITSAECISTDLNYYQAGTTSFEDKNYTDYCVSDLVLNEFSCDSNNLTEDQVNCDYGCYQGACQEITSDTNINCELLNKNEFITDEFNVFSIGLKDTCLAYNAMRDYYCETNTLTFRQVECEFDCDINSGHCFVEKNYLGCVGYTKTDSCGTYENDCANCGYSCQEGYQCKLITNQCGNGAYGVCELVSVNEEETTSIELDYFKFDAIRGDELTLNITIHNNNSTTRTYTIESFGLFKFAEYTIEPSSKTLEIKNGESSKFILKVIPNEKAVFGRNNFQITISSKGDTIYRKDMWVYLKENQDDPDELQIIAENCNGCVDNFECLPIGYRDSGKYCKSKSNFENTKSDLEVCNNDYECKSNNCKDNKCIPSCNGCDFGGANFCVPIGTRVQELYCSSELINEVQKDTAIACENNYECSSNLCIDNECIEKGFFKKIIVWFRNIFR